MSVPLILTILAGAATFIGAFLGVLGQKPSNRLLAFSLGFAAGIMLLISLMEMLPAALAAEGMSPVLGYGMFIFGLLGYFGLDRMLPHAHPQDLMQKSVQPLPKSIKRTAILLTLGISLHNFPEGIATFVTASSNLELVCITSRKGLPPLSRRAATWSWDLASHWPSRCTIFLKVWRLQARFMQQRVLNARQFCGRGFLDWQKFLVVCWRG